MKTHVVVRNPSEVPRDGHVAVPLDASDVLPERWALFHDGDEVFAQLDDQLGDSTRREVSFLLDKKVCKGDERYETDCATLDLRAQDATRRGHPYQDPSVYDVVLGRGFKMRNGRISLWFNLTPDLDYEWERWYAGCATSVQLDGTEILDPHRAAALDFFKQDREKRMQIDSVRLSVPAWEGGGFRDYSLSDRAWTLLHHGHGPVRAFATIQSPELEYTFFDLASNETVTLAGNLYRTLSLYRDADYIIEQLWLQAKPREGKIKRSVVDLSFTARYFLYYAAGSDGIIVHFPDIPDWFSIGVGGENPPGYGFSTDAHVTAVQHPHSEFPHPGGRRGAIDMRSGYPLPDADHTFSWQLGSATTATALHLFKRGLNAARIAEESGRAWHDNIFRPLRGAMRS